MHGFVGEGQREDFGSFFDWTYNKNSSGDEIANVRIFMSWESRGPSADVY